MKLIVLIISIIIILPAHASSSLKEHTSSREDRELAMAENAILTSLMVAQNPTSRYLCTQNAFACIGPDKTELALALIASRSSSKSLSTLANVLRFRIDGGLSEDFECYTLNKGKKMTEYLRKLNTDKLAKKCKDDVSQVVNRNKGLFSETSIEVCADPVRIKERVRDLLESIRSSTVCSNEDF